MMVWKMWLPLKMAIFGIYVRFLGCRYIIYPAQPLFFAAWHLKTKTSPPKKHRVPLPARRASRPSSWLWPCEKPSVKLDISFTLTSKEKWKLHPLMKKSIYIYIYIPGICLSSILGLEPSKRRPLLFNTRVMWVPGIHNTYFRMLHHPGCP